jgi:tetratricopeptide (TPR) repeat protein
VFYNEELLSEAKKHIDAALRKRPESLFAHETLARYHSLQGNYVEAVSELKKAIALAPESNNYHNMLANELCYSLDRFEEALAEYEGCIRRDPDNVWTYHNIHWIYTELGQHEKALESIKRVNERIPSYDGGYLLQGRSYLSLNQPEKAREAFAKVLILASDSIKAGVRIAETLLKLNRPEDALPYLRQAVNKRPGAVWTHQSLANGLKINWQLPEAIAEYKAALDIKGDDLGSLAGLGHTLALAGQFDEARKIYREYAEKKLSHMFHCYAEKWIGMTYAHTGQYGKALKHLKTSHKEAEKENNKKMTHDIKIIQASLLHEQGQYGKAVEIYKQALDEAPHADLVRGSLGLSYMKMGATAQLRETMDDLSRRLQNGAPKTHARYLYEIKSELFYQEGQLDSAAFYAEQALKVRNDRADLYKYQLAKILLESGGPDSTIKICEGVIRSPLNKPYFVYLRSKARLLKARALAQQGHSERALEECQIVLQQLRKADRDLPLAKAAKELRQELLNNMQVTKKATLSTKTSE